MSKFALILAAMMIGALFLPQSASANSMRCGMHVIESGGRHGPGKYEVLKKCGDPTERMGDTWIYDRPDGTVILRFDPIGLLTRISYE